MHISDFILSSKFQFVVIGKIIEKEFKSLKCLLEKKIDLHP